MRLCSIKSIVGRIRFAGAININMRYHHEQDIILQRKKQLLSRLAAANIHRSNYKLLDTSDLVLFAREYAILQEMLPVL